MMEKISVKTEYAPSPEQVLQLATLRELVESCEKSNIEMYVLGGYGMDGLYGSLTRDHGDIDLAVSESRLNDFKNIIEKMGFVMDASHSTDNKLIYKRNGELTAGKDFKIEFAPISILEKLLPENVDLKEVISQTPNGHLNGLSFRTSTPYGQKIITNIQNIRAMKEGWGEYKYKEHSEKLMDAIEAQVHRQVAPDNAKTPS